MVPLRGFLGCRYSQRLRTLRGPVRWLPWATIFTIALSVGCGKKTPPECQIRLQLPATSIDPVDGRRFGRLTVNQLDFADVAGRSREFKIKLHGDRDRVSVVYDFWPTTYTNIIRSKVVPVGAGQSVDIDLTTEDAANPDQIKLIYFSTPMTVVEQMCRLANIGPNDVVYDIGCGDGRMVITAVAKFGAKRGVGIDIDPDRIAESRAAAAEAGVLPKIDFQVRDALAITDFSEATVVMMFMGENLNMKIRPTLHKTMKSGARLVSHQFDMGDWKPDKTEHFTAVNDQGMREEFTLYLRTNK